MVGGFDSEAAGGRGDFEVAGGRGDSEAAGGRGADLMGGGRWGWEIGEPVAVMCLTDSDWLRLGTGVG